MEKKTFFKNFIRCGLIGWCLECFWTGLGSLFFYQDSKLTCRTSLLMFPIYGMAALIAPFSQRFKNRNFLFRGSIYTALIYATEYFSGLILKAKNICPWDYSHAEYNLNGLIRLDYAPVWFVVGLLYEYVLNKK